MASSVVKTAKKLLKLTVPERRKFIESFDHVMVDCDGCIWSLFSPIEGAGEGLRALEQLNKQIIYVSNNSVRSVENYRDQLMKIGLVMDERYLVNSSIAIVHYLQKIQFQGLIYVVGSLQMRNRLQREGFDIIYGPDEPIEETGAALFKVISDTLPVKAVIYDVEFNYNYVKYMRAQKYLANPECILIAGAMDRKISLGTNVEFAGPGPFMDLFQTHSPPVVLGKPGAALAEVLVDKYKIPDPRRILFIGDTLEQDIMFGNKNGFQTMLVLTGITNKEEMEQQTEKTLIPDYYTDSLADLVDLTKDYSK